MHICISDWASHAIWIKYISRINNCYLCPHTHTTHLLPACLAGWLACGPPVGREKAAVRVLFVFVWWGSAGRDKGSPQLRAACLPPLHPSDQTWETAQECFTGLPRDGRLFPETGDTCTWCSAFLILLSHRGLKRPLWGERGFTLWQKAVASCDWVLRNGCS